MAPKKIVLPGRFDDDDPKLSRFVAEFFGRTSQPVSDSFNIDFSKLRWIDGAAITVLSNTLERLRKRDIRVEFSGLDIQMAGVQYLDDSSFFEMYSGQKISKFSKARDTTIPLRKLARSSSFDWLHNVVVPWLSAKLNMGPESFAEVVTCIYEIFNNIEDHSEEKIGCVFVQYFPQMSKIAVSISDFGIGIPGSMRPTFPGLSDGKAIEMAFEEGVTSKRHGRNLGAGLWLLRQNVVTRNRGELSVFSNLGRFRCSLRGESVHNSVVESTNFYPGTLLRIVLRTDTIEPRAADTEELVW